MTAPNGFFVDVNSTITPKNSLSVDPTTGVPSINTVDGGGNPVVTLCGGGGGGGTPANAISPKAAGTGAIGTSTNYARQDHTHPVNDGVDIGLITTAQKAQITAGGTSAILNAAKTALKDPAGVTDIPIAPINAAQVTQLAASATVALLNSGKSALKDPAGGADIPLGGTVATTWQTYTPSATNTVHIAIDRASGPNVMLNAPVDNTQVIDAPLNMADGAEMQINLVGGGGSGNWAAFAFVGAAPTATATSANYVAVYVKRRGSLYEGTVGQTRPV